METFTQDKAIEWLIDDDINDLQQMFMNDDFSYIHDILSGGFDGYNSFTKDQLAQEISERKEEEVAVL